MKPRRGGQAWVICPKKSVSGEHKKFLSPDALRGWIPITIAVGIEGLGVWRRWESSKRRRGRRVGEAGKPGDANYLVIPNV